MSDPAAAVRCAMRGEESALPTTREVMHWIRAMVERGARRPGFEADQWTEQWIADQLRGFGCTQVWSEPIEVVRWQEQVGELTLQIDGVCSTWECFPVPMSAPQADIRGEVALDTFDSTSEASSIAGKIALYLNQHVRVPAAFLRDELATASYDPANDFDQLIHTQPFGPRILEVMEPALRAGALGFIGIVGQGWESDRYFVPYDAVSRDLPGVWITPATGQRLLEAIESGQRVEARIRSQSSQYGARSHNVMGTLPGRSNEWVILGSHHDAPWCGAVEDASGTALVLAQAHYWSQIPERDRPWNFLFLLNGGHMSGGAGIRHFVATHRDLIDRSVVAIHLEHVAREPRVENGTLLPSDEVTPRWWFTSRIAPLEAAVSEVLRNHDLRRSLILPPNAMFENPPTDGSLLHPAGVPIVQLLAAPEYLFDCGDRVEMVHEDSLLPITRAVVDLVTSLSLSSWDGARLRALDRDRPDRDRPERQ